MVKTNLNRGYVTQIIGPVLDIKFPSENSISSTGPII